MIPGIEIADVPKGERAALIPILEESFEGLYLWHAKRTLQGVEVVRVARTPAGEAAGLIMLKVFPEDAGYVYYVAVSRRFRRQGVGGRLLDDAMSYLVQSGVRDVYASVEEENEASKRLFGSRGFEELKGSEMGERYGKIRALIMRREMMVVPGEVLLSKRLADAKGG
jgi:ribosomal protein S18 acetylase RimI-like enzyme